MSHNFKAHMKTHTVEAKVECAMCAISFSKMGNLRIHIISYAYEHECIANGNSKLSAFYYCKINWQKLCNFRLFVRTGRAPRGQQRQAGRKAAIRLYALDFFASCRSSLVDLCSARVAAKRRNQPRLLDIYLINFLCRLDGNCEPPRPVSCAR